MTPIVHKLILYYGIYTKRRGAKSDARSTYLGLRIAPICRNEQR